MTNKLFVGGISYNITEDQLNDYFAPMGQVLSAKIIKDKYSGQSKGFAFVEMATEDDAKRAMDKLNNTMLDGRTIVVKEALPQEDRSNSTYNRNNNRSGGRDFNNRRSNNRY